MNCQHWIAHFRANKNDRPEPDWSAPFSITGKRLRLLRKSLAEYQLGDGGGECRLVAADAEKYRGASGDAGAVVDAWFAEEREHSRLLACAVTRIGGEFITSTPAFRLFYAIRRTLGVQFEMLVLLIVEIVSTGYYRGMWATSRSPRCANSSCATRRGTLTFIGTASRRGIRAAWRLCGSGTFTCSATRVRGSSGSVTGAASGHWAGRARNSLRMSPAGSETFSPNWRNGLSRAPRSLRVRGLRPVEYVEVGRGFDLVGPCEVAVLAVVLLRDDARRGERRRKRAHEGAAGKLRELDLR